MANPKKKPLAAVPAETAATDDAAKLVQEAIGDEPRPDLKQAANVQPQRPPQPTHAVVPLATIGQLIPFLHGHGSDMAKSFAMVLGSAPATTLPEK